MLPKSSLLVFSILIVVLTHPFWCLGDHASISQQSFDTYGSLQLSSDGCYVLQEDIIFDNSNEQSYSQSGSIISISSSNIVLDLNNHTIKQSKQTFERQFGFFSSIYISPGYNNITIKNGDIGLTSHCAIYSQSTSNITIENIRIHDFVTYGIKIDYDESEEEESESTFEITNVEIGPSSSEVYLTLDWKQGKSLIPIAEKIAQNTVLFSVFW